MSIDPKDNVDRLFACFKCGLSTPGRRKEQELDSYLSNKHDQLLRRMLQPNTYRKRNSLAIVDGFAVEVTQEQADIFNQQRK